MSKLGHLRKKYFDISFGKRENAKISNLSIPDARLSSEIPNLKFEIFVRHLLDVEADRRDGCHDFTDLKEIVKHVDTSDQPRWCDLNMQCSTLQKIQVALDIRHDWSQSKISKLMLLRSTIRYVCRGIRRIHR